MIISLCNISDQLLLYYIFYQKYSFFSVIKSHSARYHAKNGLRTRCAETVFIVLFSILLGVGNLGAGQNGIVIANVHVLPLLRATREFYRFERRAIAECIRCDHRHRRRNTQRPADTRAGIADQRRISAWPAS